MQQLLLALRRRFGAVFVSLLFAFFLLVNDGHAGPVVDFGASDSVGTLAQFEATAFQNASNDRQQELFLVSPNVGAPATVGDSDQFTWAGLNSLLIDYDPVNNVLTASVFNFFSSSTLVLASLGATLDVNGTPIEFMDLNVLDIAIGKQNANNSRILNLLDVTINGTPVAGGNDLLGLGALSQFHISGIDLTQPFTFTALIEVNGNFNNSNNNFIDILFGFEIPVPINAPSVGLLFGTSSLYLFICQRRRRQRHQRPQVTLVQN